MNGQTLPARGSPGLLAALVASLLMHGAVISLPYLGQSARASKAVVAVPRVPPRLVATLMTTPRQTARKLPAIEPTAPATEPPPVSPAEETQPDVAPREGADVLPLDAPVFYPTDQLTQRPQIVANTELDTPEIRPILASGKIVLKLWISDLGQVVEVEVEKSDLPEVFAREAIGAFKRIRFTPGQRNGKPVGTIMRIEVSYDDGRKPPEPPAPTPAPAQP